MIIKGNSIIGKKVITVQKGKQIEDVDDLIYDPIEQKVLALLVDPGGWFSDAKVIQIEDIKSFGPDAVVVESDAVLKKASDVDAKVSNIAKKDNNLTKTKVFTKTGRDLGYVTDILFDTATGEVLQFEVSQGRIKDIQSGKKTIDVADIVTVGEDAIIVETYTEELFKEQAEQQGLQGALNQTQSKDKVRASQLKKRIASEYEKIRNDPAAKSALSQTEKEYYNLKDNLGEQFSKVKDVFYSQINSVKGSYDTKRKEDAVGKFLTKTILTPDDKILAKKGDMVTHKLVSKAEGVGLLYQIIENTSVMKLTD